jgi:hypothetical protein
MAVRLGKLSLLPGVRAPLPFFNLYTSRDRLFLYFLPPRCSSIGDIIVGLVDREYKIFLYLVAHRFEAIFLYFSLSTKFSYNWLIKNFILLSWVYKSFYNLFFFYSQPWERTIKFCTVIFSCWWASQILINQSLLSSVRHEPILLALCCSFIITSQLTLVGRTG